IISRDAARYEQDYERGVALYNLRRIRETTRHGTKITFKPDPQIFQVTEFNYRLLSERLRETAYLNPGLRISLSDERIDRGDEFFFRNGIADFVRLLNKNKAVLPDEPIHLLREPSDEEPLGIEIALQYASYCSERVTSFANYIKTIEGGTHATGFRAGLARAIETHARLSDQSKRSTRSLNAEDVFEGLVAVVSVKLSQPQFSDWTRARLDSEITDQVEAFVSERLGQYFREHPSMAQKIVDKVVRAVCDARRSETR
ncbi:MAG TPA: hypothetical protein VEZ90_05580, partial [Blastocatellia bacterium]|nr:hypothetical protein [Blastocatellia bacterium]